MSRIPCPACGGDTIDGLPCPRCTRRLRADLAELPDLIAELEVTATRQNVTAARGRQGAREDPLPFNWDASDQVWAVRNTLLTWVMTIELGDADNLADDPAEWCRWLAKRIERIRGHDEVDQLIDEIGSLPAAIRRIVDLPTDGAYCGTCDVCGRHLYASREAIEVVCRYCDWAGIEAVYPVEGRRRDMASRAEEIAVLTKREILDVAPAYRLPINSSTFSNWVSRGKLTAVEHRHGVPRYRLADALRLARKAKREAAAETRRRSEVA